VQLGAHISSWSRKVHNLVSSWKRDTKHQISCEGWLQAYGFQILLFRDFSHIGNGRALTHLNNAFLWEAESFNAWVLTLN
jgi:hypothetical protein